MIRIFCIKDYAIMIGRDIIVFKSGNFYDVYKSYNPNYFNLDLSLTVTISYGSNFISIDDWRNSSIGKIFDDESR